LKLTIAFDGRAYAGWQAQACGTAVQDVVERAMSELFGGAHRLHSSSRTDSGVHALGMCAHVDLPSLPAGMEDRKIRLALNARLPEDIRIVEARRVSSFFHARFDAVGKEYHYQIWNHPAMNPLLRNVAWHVPQQLDVKAMREAARFLEGRHDFRSMAANHGYHIKDTVRTLHEVKIVRKAALLTVRISGEGFLYKMCRGIVGTLVQVGRGRFRPSDIRRMLEAKDRRVAGMTAPAHGLTLHRVLYRRGAEAMGRKAPRDRDEHSGTEEAEAE